MVYSKVELKTVFSHYFFDYKALGSEVISIVIIVVRVERVQITISKSGRKSRVGFRIRYVVTAGGEVSWLRWELPVFANFENQSHADVAMLIEVTVEEPVA